MSDSTDARDHFGGSFPLSPCPKTIDIVRCIERIVIPDIMRCLPGTPVRPFIIRVEPGLLSWRTE